MKTYHVIEYEDKRSLVMTTPRNPERLYWFGGTSYMYNDPSVTFIHTYDPVDDPDDADGIVIAYWREWNPPVTGQPDRCGWLSPDGNFYPCEWGEHESLADQISAAICGNLEGSRYLDDHNWIRVQDGHVVSRGLNGYPPVTQEQLNILWDIAQLETLTERERRWALHFLQKQNAAD